MTDQTAPQDLLRERLLEASGRRRDREATKQALLAAGLQVFAERGYDAATTREVAQAAGVNEQLIQRYFGGKEGLLVAIIERFGEEERRCCAMPPPCESLEAEIRGFLDYQLERASATSDFSKVALHRSLCDPEVAREIGRRSRGGRDSAVLAELRPRVRRPGGLRRRLRAPEATDAPSRESLCRRTRPAPDAQQRFAVRP
jgi:AcrR family transcriptional regulator